MVIAPISRRRGRLRRRPFYVRIAVMVAALLIALGAYWFGTRAAGDSDQGRLIEEWGTPYGRWHTNGWRDYDDEETELTAAQEAEFEKLLSLGYLTGSNPKPSNEGVVYDAERAYDGLNFYTSGNFPGAILMDMRGNVIHRWRKDFLDAWGDRPAELLPRSSKGKGYWRRAYLFENGDVLAIFEGAGIIKVDRNSNLLWARFGGFHHDLEVMDDGRIYVLTREPSMIPRVSPDHPVLEDFIAVLDADGNELRRVSVLEAFEDSDYPQVVDGLEDGGDVFHTNTVEVLKGRLADDIPAFAEGNVLVSLRERRVIAVIDMDTGRAVWAMVGSWVAQHQPTVLDNCDILIFDNKGDSGASQVIEFDPVEKKPVWVYRAEERGTFYSRECGSNQRLPNGNTLITESDRGTAFEVTPDLTTVWKYLNPAQAGEDGEYIATLFEVVRLEPDFPIDWAGGG